MRIIERRMCDVIAAMLNNANNVTDSRTWHRENTTVRQSARGDIYVELHSNVIAVCFNGMWRFNLCGWNTVTTRSRITALAKEFAGFGGVASHKGVPRKVYLEGGSLWLQDVPVEGWWTG